MSTSLAGVSTRVISTEMLEHDPHWRESVQRMIELVKGRTSFGLGGTLIITCAAPGRGEHELACSPLPEYYQEIGGAELAALVRSWFERVRWWQMPPGNPGGCSVDTYLLGVGAMVCDEVALGVFTHRTTYLPGLLGSLETHRRSCVRRRLRRRADQRQHGAAVAGAATDDGAVLGLPG